MYYEKSGKESYFKNKVKGISKKTVALDITNVRRSDNWLSLSGY